tara:strand:+ start:40740 stop:41363 length:624 start_codon:yes stop_codon:yes gene_type:complete
VNGERMASLWQFFGLPDPESSVDTRKRPSQMNEKQPSLNAPLEQQSLGDSAPVDVRKVELPDVEQPTIQPTNLQKEVKKIPDGWNGPVSADGEAFHDLGAHSHSKNTLPRRALRYVAPDEMKRIPTQHMAQRIGQGDTIIVDLRPMVHMDTHQNVCRRELQQMSNDVGVGIFALDPEDKVLLLPGNDVVVDVGRHELGLVPLLHEES